MNLSDTELDLVEKALVWVRFHDPSVIVSTDSELRDLIVKVARPTEPCGVCGGPLPRSGTTLFSEKLVCGATCRRILEAKVPLLPVAYGALCVAAVAHDNYRWPDNHSDAVTRWFPYLIEREYIKVIKVRGLRFVQLTPAGTKALQENRKEET
jgi:hypothetical protein